MAIFIFQKNSDGKEGSLIHIAASQEIWDANKVQPESLFDLVTVNDELFNAVRLNNKGVISKTGDTVNTMDLSPVSTGGNFIDYKHEENKEALIERLDKWLKLGKSGTLADQVTAYKAHIESLGTEAIAHSFEKHAEDNGVTAVHPLQLV
jgi:hypothetical protein|tara:strand:- start:2352 stop:2801 length:450 start_codon:yes stop_codon:yes gene_type:complete